MYGRCKSLTGTFLIRMNRRKAGKCLWDLGSLKLLVRVVSRAACWIDGK